MGINSFLRISEVREVYKIPHQLSFEKEIMIHCQYNERITDGANIADLKVFSEYFGDHGLVALFKYDRIENKTPIGKFTDFRGNERDFEKDFKEEIEPILKSSLPKYITDLIAYPK